MFLSLGVAVAVICFVIDLQSFSCTEAWTGPPSARPRRRRRYGKRTMVNLEVLELIHPFIPLLLSNLRFRGEKTEAWAQRVATLNRILNMCSQPSFVVLGTLKGWYLVILSKGKQWAIFFFFIDYGTHFLIRDEYYLQIVSHFFSKLQSISIQAIASLTLFRPDGLFEPPLA